MELRLGKAEMFSADVSKQCTLFLFEKYAVFHIFVFHSLLQFESSLSHLEPVFQSVKKLNPWKSF